jgi:hypothetical protein
MISGLGVDIVSLDLVAIKSRRSAHDWLKALLLVLE